MHVSSRLFALFFLTIFLAGGLGSTNLPAQAEDAPNPLDQLKHFATSRLADIHNSTGDDGEKAREYYTLKKELLRRATLTDNATLSGYATGRIGDVNQRLFKLAERGKDDLAVYVYAYDQYISGLFAETSPTPEGRSSTASFVKAVKWLKRAQDFPPALVLLGTLYEQGKGVTRSPGTAAKYLYRAALAYLEREDPDQAVVMLERIQHASPGHHLAQRLSTVIYGSPSGSSESLMSTGFVVPTGHIATNLHAVAGKNAVTVKFPDGRSATAKLVAQSPGDDLALLVLEEGFSPPPAIPVYPGTARLAQSVFTIGYPHPSLMGSTPKVTAGRVNALAGMGDDPRTYQVSVPAQPGNSGGPLLDMHGRVVGVMASTLSAARLFQWTGDLPQNVNYAVKSERLAELLQSVSPAPKRPVSLSVSAASLESLAERVQNSVGLIVAE